MSAGPSAAAGGFGAGPLHDPATHEVARAAGVSSAIPEGVSRAVAQGQSAIDPLMPLLLVALLTLTAWLLWRRRQHIGAQAAARNRRGVNWPRPSVIDVDPWLDAHVVGGVVLLLGSVFAWLAWTIHSGPYNPVLRLDATLAGAAAAVANPVLHWWAMRLSDLGDVLPLSLLTVAVTLWLLRRRQRVLAAGWLLGIVINSVGVRVLKNVIERARPSYMPDVVTSGFSFPSGHAAGALMVFGLLAWVLVDQFGARWRFVTAMAAALVIFGIGASRVLLGVHYASDVLGGLLWGAMMLVTAIAITRQARDA